MKTACTISTRTFLYFKIFMLIPWGFFFPHQITICQWKPLCTQHFILLAELLNFIDIIFFYYLVTNKSFCKTMKKGKNIYMHRLSITHDLVKVVDIRKRFSFLKAIKQVVGHFSPSPGYRIHMESDWLTSILGILMRSDVAPLALYPYLVF